MHLDADAAALVARALREDVGEGDWTTLWTVLPDTSAEARILAKADGVVAGLELAAAVFAVLDPVVRFDARQPNGHAVTAGDTIATLSGPARAILTGERTALNFVQRLSGVASLTRRFVDAVAGTGVRILDTRKTTPGWRAVEKAAVRAGGGENHRLGLHDMVLIKENHVAAAGGLAAAIERVHNANDRGLAVEVEVRDLTELDTAMAGHVDRILLDNMSLEDLREAVRRVRTRDADRRPELEASGNITLDRVRPVAETGVDAISIGALTHSAPALDLSLLVAL
jgi:nicotinate-nucleotide pyrophosphorylase (carboxylating)